MKTYVHAQETWDEAKCAKVARHRAKDSWGRRHPYPGLVSPFGSAYPTYGNTVRYNGGVIHNGVWYEAEFHPLPSIPSTYEFYTIPSWGVYLRKRK